MSILLELLADFLGLLFLESAWEDYGNLSEKSPAKRFWIRVLFLIGFLIYCFTAAVLMVLVLFILRLMFEEGFELSSGIILALGLVLAAFILSKFPRIWKNFRRIFIPSTIK